MSTPVFTVGALVQAARRGDPEAWHSLAQRYLPVVRKYVAGVLPGPHVDDAVQETFLRAVRALSSLRDPAHFEPWLMGIAVNLVQDRLRRPDREEPVGLRLPASPGQTVERTVVGRVMADDQRRELVDALPWMDPEHRRLLSLWRRELDGELTREELVVADSTTPGAARVRLLRMRRQLDAARMTVRAINTGGTGCADLGGMIGSWDGTPSSVGRKRFSRHVRDCPACRPLTEDLLAAEVLLARAAPLAVFPHLLDAALQITAPPASALPVGQHLLTWLRGLFSHGWASAVTATAAVGAAAGLTILALPAPPPFPPQREAQAPPATALPTPRATPAAKTSVTPPAKRSAPPDVRQGPALTVRSVIADMTSAADAAPHGVPPFWDWAKGPVKSAGNPDGMRAFDAEGHVYQCASGHRATNVRVELRNIRTWMRDSRTGAWRLAQDPGRKFGGGSYAEDYEPSAGPAGVIRTESDGSRSVRVGDGRNFRFWGPDRVTIDPAREGGIVTSVQARLVVDDRAKADDRESACLVLSMSGSYWRAVDSTATDGALRSAGYGRFKSVRRQWRNFSFTTLRPDALTQARPPLS